MSENNEKKEEVKEEKSDKLGTFLDYFVAVLLGVTTILAALAGY